MSKGIDEQAVDVVSHVGMTARHKHRVCVATGINAICQDGIRRVGDIVNGKIVVGGRVNLVATDHDASHISAARARPDGNGIGWIAYIKDRQSVFSVAHKSVMALKGGALGVAAGK